MFFIAPLVYHNVQVRWVWEVVKVWPDEEAPAVEGIKLKDHISLQLVYSIQNIVHVVQVVLESYW